MKIECPMCSKVLQVPDDYGPRPFCSARCKLADLSNWLDEKYKIPLDESDDTSEEVSRE